MRPAWQWWRKSRQRSSAPTATTDRPPCGAAGSSKRWRWARFGALGLALAAIVGGVAFTIWARSLTPPLERARSISVTVLDREDRLLRAYTTSDGRWRLPVTVREVDPRYLDMLLAYEDRRYRQHHGIDPMAVLRAACQLVVNGRIVSGASTLTMQVARLLDEPAAPRGLQVKLRQMALALALERSFTKDEILGLYLRLAPFGGNVEGVRAASLTYFGKEPARLSVGERALLVAIPQSPEARRPDRDPGAARRARDRVLDRMQKAGVITTAKAADASPEPVPRVRRAFPRLAPPLPDAETAAAPAAAVHPPPLDRARQRALEALAREHAQKLGPQLSVALIVIEHKTGEIIAQVGSADYLDASRLGAIDMTSAVRSPGSTLKPLIYGLAFERGLAMPETMIEDRPTRFGRYAPSNFDEDFRGTVTIREALALSLNIPAVKVLAEVGPKRLVGRMRRAGIEPKLPTGAEPSLAIALGGVGITLHDLAQIYTALGRGGEPMPLTHRRADAGARKRSDFASRSNRPSKLKPRLLTAAAAWHVADILKGAPPPAGAKGARIGFKTGTSYGYRDGWAAGSDGRYTVAVWAPRADATATPGLTGHGSAAPLLFDALARLSERPTPLAGPPPGAQRIRNADLPLPLRRFRDGTDTAAGAPPVAIAFPPDRSELEHPDKDAPEIVLKAEGGALPLTWVVDGLPLEPAGESREVAWTPTGSGFAKIAVIDANGRTDRVTVRLR